MTGRSNCDSPEPITGFFGEFRFLSNFWPAAVEYNGMRYRTVEHAYQAAKTLDQSHRRKVKMLESPGKAKRLGSKFELRPDWDDIKVEVMLDLVRQKFTNHPELKGSLLSTGAAVLIESNSWGDTFWGVCDGEGNNRLGQILMRVRDEISA